MSKVSMVHKSWLYHKCTLCYVCRSLCTSPWIVGCQLTLLIFLPMARFSSVKVHWSFRPSETITNWSEASAPMPKALKSSVNTFIMCACWRACKTLQSENVPVEIWTGAFYVSLLTDSGANRQTNAAGNIFSLSPRQRNKVHTIVLIHHHHISTEYSCIHNTGWDWVIYGWYFEHGLLRSRWKRRYHKNSFYLGVTELTNFFSFSDLRMFSFSFSLSSLGSYWVNTFLWTAL